MRGPEEILRNWIDTLSGRRRYTGENTYRHLTTAGRHEGLSRHQMLVLQKRRAKNKIARRSRKLNRQRAKG